MTAREDAMNPADALFQTILAEPDDDAPRLVYADWLEEHGDPARAEFIRLQCEWAALPEGHPQQAKLIRRWRDLLEPRHAAWQKVLPEWLRKETVGFRRGFPDHVNFPATEFLARFEEAWQYAPVQFVKMSDAAAHVEELAASPLLARLRGLDLSHANPALGVAALEALLNSPHLTGLVRLELQGNRLGHDAAAVLAAAPNLRGLKRLRLSFGNSIGEIGARLLAASPHLRNLEELGLYGNEIGNAGVRALALSPILANVTALELRTNGVGDAGARALARSPHLDRILLLYLNGNAFGPKAEQALRGRFGDKLFL